QEVTVSFAPEGLRTQVTALGGQDYVTGQVFVSIDVSNGLAAFTPTEITVNAAEPPERYLTTVDSDFVPLIVEALDSILKARLGPNQDLDNIVMSGDNMLITLLVPKTG